MWIPETRKAYHQQTPEGDDGFVRGWDVDFWPRKIKAEKKNWNLTHLYIDPAGSAFFVAVFLFPKM